MSEANWNKIKLEVDKLTVRGSDVESKWSNLCEDTKEIVDHSIPLKTRKVK
jgi:hypothetical protein